LGKIGYCAAGGSSIVLTMVSSLFAVKGLLMYMMAPDSKPSARASPPPLAVRKLLRPRLLLDLPAHGEAVDLGHHHVEQDEVEVLLADDLEGLGPAGRGGDDEALLLEDGALETQDVLVVIYDQDPLGHRPSQGECSQQCAGF
jgi:hypothetical protein